MHFEHWSAGYNNCAVTRYSCSAAESCGFGVVYPSVLTLVRWTHTARAELFSLRAGKGWAHTTSPSHFPPGSAAMAFLHPLFLNNETHTNKATDFNKCLSGFCCWTFLFWLFDEKLLACQWLFQIVVRFLGFFFKADLELILPCFFFTHLSVWVSHSQESVHTKCKL